MSTSTDQIASSRRRRVYLAVGFIICFGAIGLAAWLFPKVAGPFQKSYWGANATHYQRLMAQLPRSFQQELEAGLPTFDLDQRATPPTVEPPSGRHAPETEIRAYSDQSGSTLRYTTDGSIPTEQSSLWSNSIRVVDSPLLRIRALDLSKKPSHTVTRTYITNLDPALPVLSLALEPTHLYDHRAGIIANPKGRGRMWERPAVLTYIAKGDDPVVEGETQIRVHGGFSRTSPRKKLRVRTSDLATDLKETFRSRLSPDARASDTWVLHHAAGLSEIYRQKLGSEVARQMGLVAPAMIPCLVYVNGEGWGVYYLMPRIDSHLVSGRENTEGVTLLRGSPSRPSTSAGGAKKWRELFLFIEENDLRQDAAYDKVAKAIDLDNLIDAWVFYVFVADTDRPHSNMDLYHDARGDNRWKFLIYDIDKGFNYLGAHIEHDTLAWHLREEPRIDLRPWGSQDNPDFVRSAILFRKLMARADFQRRFSERFQRHLADTLSTERTLSLLEEALAEIEPYRDFELLGYPNVEPRNAAKARDKEVARIREFLERRPAVMRSALMQSSRTVTKSE